MTHRLLFAVALCLGFASASCTVTSREGDTGTGGGDVDTGVRPGVDAWRDHGPGMVLIASDAPPDAPMHFDGTPDPANAPELVYPDDGVMIPPNLETFELHFRPNGSTLFRLDLSISTGDVHVYFVCSEPVSGGCIYTPDHDTWAAIQMAARGRSGVTWSVTGTDSMGRVGTSPTRSIQVASEDITGGVYYWNAAAGSIMRYEFGVPGAVEETYLRGASPINCIGCHALSRDGSHIAVGRGIPTSNVQVYDVASRMMQYQNFRDTSGTMVPGRPDFFSFNPDGTQLVMSNPMGLNIADASGAITATHITTGISTMPDWSPDGQHIVYVSVAGGPAIEAPGVTSGSLARIDLVGGAWTAGPVLADASGANNYHPTYAPDGRWIVFNHSPSNANSFGDDTSSSSNGSCVTDGELWAVASDGSSAPFQLTNIGGVCSSWPKFDPTTYQDHGHDLFWVAWATARGYGLRYGDGSIMQIWMAAFDPTLAGTGTPPTHAAFRLPFQNIATGNHIAQWVTSVQRMACTSDADCPGEFCYQLRCYNQQPI